MGSGHPRGAGNAAGPPAARTGTPGRPCPPQAAEPHARSARPSAKGASDDPAHPLLAGAFGVLLATAVATAAPLAARPAPSTFLGPLHTLTRVASTVPGNGDLNPYGVAVVPRTMGRLHRGDVLVSNFNDHTNAQGTGTSIVAVSPSGGRTLFGQVDARALPGSCPGGVGLTTALGVTTSGWVVVGSLPSRDGTAATARAGCLIVLDDRGHVRETLSGHGINGPWDMTLAEHRSRVDLFVSNVLNGTVRANGAVVHRGTVLRVTLRLRGALPPERLSTTVVGSGVAERSDPAALVIGPTGVGLGPCDTLYVADTLDNRLSAVADASDRTTSAGRGRTVSVGGALDAPLGLALAPNGHLVTANAGNGNLVETTPAGRQVAVRTVDSSGSPRGAGALFGLAIPSSLSAYLVDDATNTLQRLH